MCCCAQEEEKLEKERKRTAEREERTRKKMEDIKAKEDARLRLVQEREAKKLRDAADKERRALERKAQIEQRKKCARGPLADKDFLGALCTSCLGSVSKHFGLRTWHTSTFTRLAQLGTMLDASSLELQRSAGTLAGNGRVGSRSRKRSCKRAAGGPKCALARLSNPRCMRAGRRRW